MTEFVRLRQVCFAAPALAPAEHILREVLGLEPSHRAAELNEEFGLQNVVFPVNGSFIEIVAPLRDNTSVSKFLGKNSSQGLYIAIFDCSDLDRRRAVAKALDVRIVHEASYPSARNIQLHPRDVGGLMLELDEHGSGKEDRFGHFEWAGPQWTDHLRTDVTVDILGIDLPCTDPDYMANRWAQLLGRVVASGNGDQRIELDYGTLHFCPANSLDSLGEDRTVVHLSVRDPAAVLAKAKQVGCRTSADAFEFCGVSLRLAASAYSNAKTFL